MIHIAIVEDAAEDADIIQKYFSRMSKETGHEFALSFFTSGESFLAKFRKGSFDIILMDIDLGKGKDGLATSRELRTRDDEVLLLFMTNLAQYAIAGYQVEAFDYMVKPISYWDFKGRLTKAVDRFEKKHKTKVLINGYDNKVVVEASDIYYIEIDNHLLIYHTKNGDYSTYGSLKEATKEFQPFGFSKCSSSFLVNLAYVQKVEGYDCIVAGKRLLISHPRRKEFLNDLNRYLSNV